VYTISKTPGYKPDECIAVMSGKNGLIVSQGDGATSLNVQVPSAAQGDFEKIAQRMSQLQQDEKVVVNPDDQQERIKPKV
jgi:hypothetical protein